MPPLLRCQVLLFILASSNAAGSNTYQKKLRRLETANSIFTIPSYVTVAEQTATATPLHILPPPDGLPVLPQGGLPSKQPSSFGKKYPGGAITVGKNLPGVKKCTVYSSSPNTLARGSKSPPPMLGPLIGPLVGPLVGPGPLTGPLPGPLLPGPPPGPLGLPPPKTLDELLLDPRGKPAIGPIPGLLPGPLVGPGPEPLECEEMPTASPAPTPASKQTLPNPGLANGVTPPPGPKGPGGSVASAAGSQLPTVPPPPIVPPVPKNPAATPESKAPSVMGTLPAPASPSTPTKPHAPVRAPTVPSAPSGHTRPPATGPSSHESPSSGKNGGGSPDAGTTHAPSGQSPSVSTGGAPSGESPSVSTGGAPRSESPSASTGGTPSSESPSASTGGAPSATPHAPIAASPSIGTPTATSPSNGIPTTSSPANGATTVGSGSGTNTPSGTASTSPGGAPTDICNALASGMAPTNDTSLSLTVKMKILHTTTNSAMIQTLQDFFDADLRYLIVGCLQRRRLQQSATITNVVFNVSDDSQNSNGCGTNVNGTCLGVDVATTVYYIGSNTSSIGQTVYDDVVLRCADIQALAGVVQTFEPCQFISVKENDSNGGILVVGGGGGMGSGVGGNTTNTTNSTHNGGGIAAISDGHNVNNGLGAGGAVGVTLAGVALLLLMLLLIRRNQRTEEFDVKHLALQDDEDDTYMNDLEPDSPASNRIRIVNEDESVFSGWSGYTEKHSPGDTSVDADATSADIVTMPDDDENGHLRHLGASQVSGLTPDGKSNGSFLTGGTDGRWRHKRANNTTLAGNPLDKAHLGHDVHMCSSATCELCEQRRRQGNTGLHFIPARMPAHGSALPLHAAREYVAEDTIDL